MISISRRVSTTILTVFVSLAPLGVSFAPLFVSSAPAWTQTPAQPARANTVDTGVINGAPYYIEIPAQWNKGLVMYAHGYTVVGSRPPAQDSPRMKGVRDAFLSRGFAFAASDYSVQGWAVKEAIEETEALRRYFVGETRRADRKPTSPGIRWAATLRWPSSSAIPRSTRAQCRCAVRSGRRSTFSILASSTCWSRSRRCSQALSARRTSPVPRLEAR